jgi:hypothetical protein
MWGDLRGYCIFGTEANRVYLNRGADPRLQFVDVAPHLGWKAETNSRGVALVDLDNDGALDVVITHQFEPISVYRNTLHDRAAGRRHWIGFRLVGNGRTCNRDAAGSRVTIAYGEGPARAGQMREITIVNGLSAQNDRRAHFGLGAWEGPVTARVSWCGEPARDLGAFAPGRYHVVAQPSPEAGPGR